MALATISRRARRNAASHKSNRRAQVRQLAKAARSTVFAPLLRDLAPFRLFDPVGEFLALARCEFLQREGGR